MPHIYVYDNLSPEEIHEELDSSVFKWEDIVSELRTIESTLLDLRATAGTKCGFCRIVHGQEGFVVQPCNGCPLWDDEDSDTCSPHWDAFMDQARDVHQALRVLIQYGEGMHEEITNFVELYVEEATE